MAKLIIRLGTEERTVELTDEVSSIGRSADCVIPIRHKSLSRTHCEIRRAGDGFLVRDCGSLNGTLVNGKKVVEHRLEPGDRIDLGMARIHFERVSERARAKPSPEEALEEGAEPVVVPEESPGALPSSYVAWSRRGARGAGWLIGLVAAALVLVGGYAGVGALLGPGGPKPDADNLLAGNPSFEASAPEGLPPGWAIPIGAQSRVWIARGEAKDGLCALEVEKAPAPGEFVLACTAETPIDLQPGTVYAVSGWIRTQGLKGAAALRCVARTVPGGLVVGRAYSAAVEGSTGWKPVDIEFVAPRGAKRATIECVVAGPEGRAAFDGLRVVRREGEVRPDPAAAFEFKDFRVVVRPGGAFHLMRKQGEGREKWVLADARLVLRTPSGAVDQGFAAGMPEGAAPTREGAAGPVTLKTRILHPGSLQWVPVTQSLTEVDGEFRMAYEIAGEGVRPEDEVGIELTSPLADPGALARVETASGEQVADLADISASGASRFLWRDSEAAYVVRYPPFPVTVAGGRRAGVLRLEQFVEASQAWAEPAGAAAAQPGPKGGGGPAFALGVTATLQRELGNMAEELVRATELERQGRTGEALEICRRVADVARARNEAALSADAERRVREIEARAERELAAARRLVLAARLVGGADARSAAARALVEVERRLPGTRFAEDARLLAGEIEPSGDADAAHDPAAQAYRLAAHHLARGDKALGRLLIEFLKQNCKDSPWAQEVEKLQEQLDAAPPEKQGGNGGR